MPCSKHGEILTDERTAGIDSLTTTVGLGLPGAADLRFFVLRSVLLEHDCAKRTAEPRGLEDRVRKTGPRDYFTTWIVWIVWKTGSWPPRAAIDVGVAARDQDRDQKSWGMTGEGVRRGYRKDV